MRYRWKQVGLASFAAFVAWGLAVQRLPVLRFLGYAFNSGIFVASAVLLLLVLTTSRSVPPRSAIPHVPAPLLTTPSTWHGEKARFLTARAYSPVQLYPESFVVSHSLDSLLRVALRDFIDSWYRNISHSPAFVNEIDREVRHALLHIIEKVRREDLINILVSRIVPIITTHFKHFDLAERAVRGKSLKRNVTESDELDLAIAAKYKDGKLHPAAALSFSDTKVIQQEHLRRALLPILPQVVTESTIKSRTVFVLLREIVACAVLQPAMQMLADPDTWNQIIEGYGKTALQDRKTVKRMRAALDQHASPPPRRQAPVELPKLTTDDSERAFERFVRAIRRVKTLSDARRFRSQIASQLAKESFSEGQDAVYLRRLEMAKRVLEQKIARLSHSDLVPTPQEGLTDGRDERPAKPRELSLPEIMHTASGLSYFMEFMDRQNKMSHVQFWIVVDGFRNPLEDDFGDDGLGGAHQTWTDTDRLDIAQISEAYISKPELKIPHESQEAISTFLTAGRKATQEQYRTARTAILTAQSAVLAELDARHLPQFRRSDLYFKFLASDEANAKGLRQHLNLDFDSPAASASLRSHVSPMIRSNSQPGLRSNGLRRAALSSTDVDTMASFKKPELNKPVRKSMDADDRPPLFDDGYDSDPLAQSTQSNRPESVDGDNVNQNEIIENMEAALTNIIADKPKPDSAFDDQDSAPDPLADRKPPRPVRAPRFLSDSAREDSHSADKPRPSLAALGLVSASSRIGVFTDNDLFPDEKKFIEDEYADQDAERAAPEDDIQPAAPGDLGLTEAITSLTTDIERLVSQEAVVDTMTRKAELTNNVAELRILGKSKASLQREIRRKELQRQQYIVQESDNSLYGRSSIRIKSVVVGKEEDGREFALYMVEVQKQGGDSMPAATWAIARRYSEFHELHQNLRRRYPSTRSLEFPRRRMVMKLQKQFLQNRRLALEAYLQELLHMPDVCRSRELRSFLSQQAIRAGLSSDNDASASDTQDLVARIYNSVTDGMDEFLGNIAVLDQLSLAGQNLISAAKDPSQANFSTSISGDGNIITVSPSQTIPVQGSIAEAEAELGAFEDKELEPFVKPICDIFLEIFELNRGNNWLRGRAVVVVLHQLLGGTVERKIRESFRSLFAHENITRYIDTIRESIWPTSLGGARKSASNSTSSTIRTKQDKERSKKEATVVLGSLIPDLAGSVVGRANANAASRRIVATMNNRRLNEHLVFVILDELLSLIFGLPMGRSSSGVGGGSSSSTSANLPAAATGTSFTSASSTGYATRK